MIAVISDVHGNLPALQSVLAEIDRLGAHRVWCLGDTLGYGPYVNECMALVSQRCEIVLAGNHDLAVRGDLDVGLFGGSAGAGVRHAIATLDERSRALLAHLRPSRVLDEVELYHASARDPIWEYVKDPRAAQAHLLAQRHPISFVGHSHLQVGFTLAPDGSSAHGGRQAPDTTMPLDPAARQVVNPGSVGQPRDRDPRAAFATIDRGGITFRRVPYDIAQMRAAVAAAGLPPEIADRLELGW